MRRALHEMSKKRTEMQFSGIIYTHPPPSSSRDKRRRRLGTALHPSFEFNPTQKAPFFMELLVSAYMFSFLFYYPTRPPFKVPFP